jgi:hypothetical protein
MSPLKERKIEKVTGIGGLFFRAHDPTALGSWYQQHLGVSLTPLSYEESVWQQAGGDPPFSVLSLRRATISGMPTRSGWSTFESGTSTKWPPSYEPQESPSRLTRSLIPTAGSLACMTLREIRSNCGNLEDETRRKHRVLNSGVHQIAPANTEGIAEQTRKGSVQCQIPPAVAPEGYQRSIRCKDLTSPRRQ